VELNSNEMFQHVQHDWNFGGIKLMTSTTSNNATATVEQLQAAEHHLNHEAIHLMDVVQEAEEVIDDMVECHNLLDNDVAETVADEIDEDDDIVDDDDDVVECIDAEQQDQDDVMSAMVDHVMDDSDGDADEE